MSLLMIERFLSSCQCKGCLKLFPRQTFRKIQSAIKFSRAYNSYCRQIIHKNQIRNGKFCEHSCKWYSNETHQRPVAQTTIDEEEREKFTKLSHMWWNELGEFRALHSMNLLRIPWIRDTLTRKLQNHPSSPALPLEGTLLLDAGSGGGIVSEPLARLGASVIGVDMVEDSITVAQTHLNQDPKIIPRIKYIHGTVEDLVGTEEEKFDAVVSSEVVEHVSDLSSFVSSCSRLIKPGGSIFITTLNKTYMSYAFAVFGAEKVLGLVPEGTHDWNKFIPPDDLQFMLDQNGLTTKLIHGLCYNPLTNRWTWIRDTSINYAIHAVKVIQDQSPENT